MLQPLNLEDCKCWVEQAISFPTYEQAIVIETCLYQRAYINNDPEVLREIAKIRPHFSEEMQQKAVKNAEKEMEQYINARLGLPQFALDDDQIAAAIISTQNNMKSARDWFAYYRILVDFCGYPGTMTNFSKRISRLDFKGMLKYPCDFAIKDVNGNFYQGLKTGGKPNWPATYIKWKTYIPDSNDNTFEQRKEVATSFYNELMKL